MPTKRRRKPINDPRHVAIHEAGHAVISIVLDIKCGGVTIKPDYKEGTAGYAVAEDPWVSVGRWMDSDKFHREYETAVRARAIIWMAGREAEVEILGDCEGGDGNDQHWFASCMLSLGFTAEQPDEWDRYAERLRTRTRALVRRHRATIERVADALLAHKSLTADAVEALVS